MKKILAMVLALMMVLAASAMAEESYNIGICQLVQHVALDDATRGFKDALTAKLGDKVSFDERNASNDITNCSIISNDFAANGVDLIMANATPALQAAMNATIDIPILGTSITDYGTALGMDNWTGVTGMNVSGTSDLAPLTEQAQMMIDTLKLQSGAKVGLLYCSSEPNSQYQVDVVREYLTGKGLVCTDYKFSDSNVLATVTEKASSDCEAIYVPTDNTVASNTEIIKNICDKPIFAGEEATCKGCGYATLSISYYNIGKVTGEMAADILLGNADIEDMAIKYDASPVKKYNKAICDELEIDTAALEEAGYVMIPGTEN